MTQAAAQVVRRHIVVPVPIEEAFDAFTGRFGDFKPPEHNLLATPIAETVFEPRVGGHIYDRATDGTECRWARVLVYEPPRRVVFSWDISPTWQVETEPDNTSEVEVRFISEDPTGPASSSSTATSTGTAPAGKRCATASPTTRAGPSTSTGTPPCSRGRLSAADLHDPDVDQSAADVYACTADRPGSPSGRRAVERRMESAARWAPWRISGGPRRSAMPQDARGSSRLGPRTPLPPRVDAVARPREQSLPRPRRHTGG